MDDIDRGDSADSPDGTALESLSLPSELETNPNANEIGLNDISNAVDNVSNEMNKSSANSATAQFLVVLTAFCNFST